jgi:hypothetical protein
MRRGIERGLIWNSGTAGRRPERIAIGESRLRQVEPDVPVGLIDLDSNRMWKSGNQERKRRGVEQGLIWNSGTAGRRPERRGWKWIEARS